MKIKHAETCGQYCPYPDTDWISPGALLPKCRGGDCTLCDEMDCDCIDWEGAEELAHELWNLNVT